MKRPSHCLNCSDPLVGDFCDQCGQKATDLNLPLRELLGDVVGDFIGFDTRLARTLRPFLTRPGQLTVDYNAGHRVRFVPPIKLYLFISFLVFLTLNFADLQMVQTGNTADVKNSNNGVARIWVNDPQEEVSGEVAGEEEAAKKAEGEESDQDGWWSTFFSDFGKTVGENPDLLNERFTTRFSQVLFLFVPIFALLLKLFYYRSRVLYIQHLTFSAYFQAFAFFLIWVRVLLTVFGTSEATAEKVNAVFFIWTAAYLFLSLRRVYGQPRLKTAIKIVLLTLTYLLLLMLGMMMILVISVLSI